MHRVAEILFWLIGISLIGVYVGMRTWSAHASEQGVAAIRTARMLHSSAPDTSSWSTRRLAEYRESLQSQAMPEAVLRIPRLNLEVPVYKGTSDLTLNRGAGRIAGTAELSSDAGNVGIAAHRDGFFRPLRNIAVGDEMYLDTVFDTRQYRVVQVHIVDPSDVSALDATRTGTITLVTCYPFYYVGSAPQRFIVRAELARTAYANED